MSVTGSGSVTQSTQQVAAYQNTNSSVEKATTKKENDEVSKEQEQQAQQIQQAQTVEQNSAAVYEKTNKSVAISQSVDPKQVDKLLKESNNQTARFKKLIETLLNKQADKNALANGISKEDAYAKLQDQINNGDEDTMVEIDDETRAQAQKDIGEGGYYSVDETSKRILDFAKAVAGSDPSKLDSLKKAVDEGFEEATKAWGKELPQISKDTYDAVMKGFDELSKQAQASSYTSNTVLNQATAGALGK